jgi:hypothetical protein
MLKNPAEYERDTSQAKFITFLSKTLLFRYQVSLLAAVRKLW